MTAIDATAGGLSDAEHDKQLRRALIASTVGTTIESLSGYIPRSLLRLF